MVDLSLRVCGQHRDDSRNERLQFSQSSSDGNHDDNRNLKAACALLVFDTLVHGDESAKSMTGCKAKQIAVTSTCPAHSLDRVHIKRVRKEQSKTLRHGLVKQYFHPDRQPT